MGKKSLKTDEEFDQQFKLMVKNIILEEDYVKKEDVKDIIVDILNLLDERIAKGIKKHAVELAEYVIQQNKEKTN